MELALGTAQFGLDFDASLSSCLWCPGAGLVKENGKSKPALKAVRKTIKRLR